MSEPETAGFEEERGTDGRWLGARYQAFYYHYREPGSAASRSVGSIAPSPTTVTLGISSTLFALGLAHEGREMARRAHECEVLIDTPESAVFFRATGLMRRYVNAAKKNERARLKGQEERASGGVTDPSPDLKEHAFVGGSFGIYLHAPADMAEMVTRGLEHLTCLGSRDSMLSPEGYPFELEGPPDGVLYSPREEIGKRLREEGLDALPHPITTATVSRFNAPPTGYGAEGYEHWWMAGGDNTEHVILAIPGRYYGTNRGRVYLKRG